MQSHEFWHQLDLPENAQLVRKETFEYSSPKGEFLIELFETIEGKYYAIGTPRHEDRLIIYGSPVLNEAKQALQVVIGKIEEAC